VTEQSNNIEFICFNRLFYLFTVFRCAATQRAEPLHDILLYFILAKNLPAAMAAVYHSVPWCLGGLAAEQGCHSKEGSFPSLWAGGKKNILYLYNNYE
jgi:hypothetical protein